MDKKKVNINVMEKLTTAELERLVQHLKKIEGFDFYVDAQFTIH